MKYWQPEKRDKKIVYLISSLRNPQIPHIASVLRREANVEVFDDWYAAGPEADDYWQKYEQERGSSYSVALRSWFAQHVYQFDLHHLNRASHAVLVLPAGRSGHLEFGYLIGQGKKGYVLFDREPERWDVMYNFATGVYFNIEELASDLRIV